MTLTERERHDAYEALEGAFGSKTDIVIAMFQPDHELARRDDLAVTRAELRGEMADLRRDVCVQIASIGGWRPDSRPESPTDSSTRSAA